MYKKIPKKLLSVLTLVMLLISVSIPTFASSTNDVGTLTIFSSNDGGSSSSNISGHAFLAFENTSSESIVVGGLNVGSGHEITFGTWGTKTLTMAFGII